MPILLALLLYCWAASPAEFFPMAVWYGGGKARAPWLPNAEFCSCP